MDNAKVKFAVYTMNYDMFTDLVFDKSVIESATWSI